MNSKIRVSGNIISELSEKIPSNIIALNELLKNSYDAGAPKVTVILDSANKTLKVIDNGSGMDKNDIDTLFHISNSKKQYGKINEHKRYTQGAKGLGFLSVFKFGKIVEWKTKKAGGIGLVFNADYATLINSNDISQIEIEIIQDDTVEIGTTITILLDEYNTHSLGSYLQIESNYKKLLNSFDDKEFTVELQINGVTYSSNNTPSLTSYLPEDQLYYVSYNSSKQIITFSFNTHEIIQDPFPFNSTKYELDLELVIYQFPPHGKNKMDKLFYNPQNDLTPLLYVNSNLFNNYDLFDPNIMKNIKTDLVMNQMIGFIRIISDNTMINFNSDRTQFLQNELTDSIKDFLTELNKRIQIIGSKNKGLKKFEFLTVSELPYECNAFMSNEEFRKYIRSDFPFRSEFTIERNNNQVTYSLFGKEKVVNIKAKPSSSHGAGSGSSHGSGSGSSHGSTNDTGKVSGDDNKPSMPSIINLNSSSEKFSVPTPQIDLKKYIASIYDSNGTLMSNDLAVIKCDEVQLNGGILPSIIEPCEKCIEYTYVDSRTGLVAKVLNLTFYRPNAKITGKNNEKMLISIPAKENYQINYNPSVVKLINQINNLDLKEYLEVIACSLRAVFEISADTLNKSNKFSALFNQNDGFDDKIRKIINFINSNKSFKTEITNSSKIDFNSLKNILDVQRFQSGISVAHLGAHKAGLYITENDIKQLASLLGVFVVVVNEMLENNNITL